MLRMADKGGDNKKSLQERSSASWKMALHWLSKLNCSRVILQLIVFGMFQSQQSKSQPFINRSMHYKAYRLSLKARCEQVYISF